MIQWRALINMSAFHFNATHALERAGAVKDQAHSRNREHSGLERFDVFPRLTRIEGASEESP